MNVNLFLLLTSVFESRLGPTLIFLQRKWAVPCGLWCFSTRRGFTCGLSGSQLHGGGLVFSSLAVAEDDVSLESGMIAA